jgi:two-component sensor histidine kinase
MTDRWTPLVERIRPYSFAALLLAIVCIGLATLPRIAFGWLGVSLLFDTYFPAVLVAALLAGIPAGVGVIIGSVIVVWWAFIPPAYVFGPLSPADIDNCLLFVISSGCIVVVAQLYRDVLHKSRARDRERELLMMELEHRGRNTYAVVEAIVRNTLVNDRASADAIAGRVRAVSSANDLVNQSNTKAVQLKALLSLEFALNAKTQLVISGPDIELSADASRKLGLVFHELVTNAMKHGALSTPDGRVVVQWRADGTKVHLLWKEEGGPPVSPPQREGFGTVVVTQSLNSLAGDIASAFNPDGLRCEIAFNCR